MKKTLILLVIIITTCSLSAQQGTVYSLYFQDHYYLNPAAAGSKGLTVFNISAKEFWLGFPENTPGSQSLVFHTRMNKLNFNFGNHRYSRRNEGRVGLGAMIYNDMNGPIRKTGAVLTYAYHIRLKEANMSFGLSSNNYQVFLNTDDIQLKSNIPDPALNEIQGFYTSDINLGFYISARDYFISLSANSLLEGKVKINANEIINDIENRQYNFATGYRFKLNTKWDVEPLLLLQVNEEGLYRMDFNARWTYLKRFWMGVGFSSKRLITFVGINSEQFDFGYSFQMPNKDVIEYSFGAHEILFTMKFGQDRFNRYQRFYR